MDIFFSMQLFMDIFAQVGYINVNLYYLKLLYVHVGYMDSFAMTNN